MSLDALLDDALLSWVDVEGRPLGEQAVTGFDEIESRLVRCPFAGDRAGGTMNVSAWQQVAAHWDAVLDTLARHGGPTAGDAWRSTARCRWGVLDAERPIPAPAAATFKTALGLTRPLTAWLITTPGAAARPLAELVPPSELLDRLDAEGWLVGHRQVCAGPPARIVEAWEALCDAPGPGAPVPVADRAAALVAGAWAILGATRAVLRAGRLDEAPGYGPGVAPQEDWPAVLHLLARPGPTALVRELPWFDPDWSLRVFAAPPASVTEAVAASTAALTAAQPLAALDAAWHRLQQRAAG